MKPFIELSAVSKSYQTERGLLQILSTVSLDIRQGEFVSLIGHSGCGKSTLLNMIGGLTSYSSGFIEIQGKVVDGPDSKVGWVFQNYSLLPWLTVRQNVWEAVDSIRGNSLGKAEKNELVDSFLQKVKLWPHKDKKPSELSGGMKQRVAIARAFSVQPEVLLLDEPFGALDALTRASMHEELLKIWNLARETIMQTIIMVTHDIEEAIFLSDRVVVMTDGPGARIGEIVDIPFARPRQKAAVLHDPRYPEIKDHLMDLLTHTWAGQEAVGA